MRFMSFSGLKKIVLTVIPKLSPNYLIEVLVIEN